MFSQRNSNNFLPLPPQKMGKREKERFFRKIIVQNEYFNEKNGLFNNFEVEFLKELLYTREAF